KAISDNPGRKVGDTLGAHAQLREGPVVANKCEALIRQQQYAAEYAVSRVIGDIAQSLSRLGKDSRFGSRTADLMDIEEQVLKRLMGQRREQLKCRPGPLIVLASDLSPSET